MTLRYNTVQFNITQYSIVQYNIIEHALVLDITVCSGIRHNQSMLWSTYSNIMISYSNNILITWKTIQQFSYFPKQRDKTVAIKQRRKTRVVRPTDSLLTERATDQRETGRGTDGGRRPGSGWGQLIAAFRVGGKPLVKSKCLFFSCFTLLTWGEFKERFLVNFVHHIAPPSYLGPQYILSSMSSRNYSNAFKTIMLNFRSKEPNFEHRLVNFKQDFKEVLHMQLRLIKKKWRNI